MGNWLKKAAKKVSSGVGSAWNAVGGDKISDALGEVAEFALDNKTEIGIGASIVAGAVVGVYAGPVAGFAVAGAGISAVSALEQAEQGEEQLDIQEERLNQEELARYLGYASDNLELLTANYTSIATKVRELEDLEMELSDNEYNIGVNNEWLSMYQAMIEGDRDNLLGQQYSILTNQVSEAESNVEMARRSLSAEQEGAEAYSRSALLEKRNAAQEGFTSYAEMMKQKSLANVMAGSTGAVKGAYSTAALSQQNQIRKFVGDDLRLDLGDGSTDASAGTFASQFAALKESISAQTLANELGIIAAQMKITSAENDVLKAENALEEQMYEWETEKEQKDFQNESLQYAVDRAREEGGTISNVRAALSTLQANAIQALRDYRSNAAAGGKTQEEIEAEVDKYEEMYEEFSSHGYSLTT